jgi:prevent-host-death family protein
MMTMVEVAGMKTMAAGKFKATCLAVMDEVQAKREPVVITKNGKPVAKLVPITEGERDPLFGFYKGNLEIPGDVISPIYSDAELEAFFERSLEQLK